MAVPAVAKSAEGTGHEGIYNYKWTVTCGTTYGYGNIQTSSAPTYVSVYVMNYLYNEDNDVVGYAHSSEDGSMTEGYVTASAYAYNKFEYRSVIIVGEVTKTVGSFGVNGSEAIDRGSDSPG